LAIAKPETLERIGSPASAEIAFVDNNKLKTIIINLLLLLGHKLTRTHSSFPNIHYKH
jgi:hypothetical protein